MIQFHHSLISGKACDIHEDFIPAMELFCRYLELSGCTYIVTSAYREDSNSIKGAVVTPSKVSNHFVGCAVDGNIVDKSKKVWTSEMLEVFAPESPKYNTNVINEVLTLLNLVRRSNTLRYGGDFKTPDPVHFDNGLNVRNPKRWQEIYDELHNTKP